MDDRLPPLRALQAFEATARHLNFSRAAAELNVTHGAVSRQVRALEERLGVRLLRRGGSGAALTSEGQILYRRAREAFDRLALGVREARRRPAGGGLTVTLSASLAVKWLVPRLGEFRARHPEVSVRLHADDRAVPDLAREGIDVGLRHGRGPAWPGVRAELLTREELVAAAAPCLPGLPPGARGGGLAPAAVLRLPLLHDECHPGWDVWARRAGVAGVPPNLPGPRFDDGAVLQTAAVNGQGAALVRRLLAADDLAAGRLIALSRVGLPLEEGLYLVTPAGGPARPAAVEAFRAWTRAGLGGSGRGDPG